MLYSDRSSRHNTPVNVIIGALILKEILGLTDEKIVETLKVDIRYQYMIKTRRSANYPFCCRCAETVLTTINVIRQSTNV